MSKLTVIMYEFIHLDFSSFMETLCACYWKSTGIFFHDLLDTPLPVYSRFQASA
jgi:hypothetical protein